MSILELEEWWSELPTVEPYFMSPKPLPALIFQALEDEDFDLFCKLKLSNKYYFLHIHCDDDSFLIRPDLTVIYHEGYGF